MAGQEAAGNCLAQSGQIIGLDPYTHRRQMGNPQQAVTPAADTLAQPAHVAAAGSIATASPSRASHLTCPSSHGAVPPGASASPMPPKVGRRRAAWHRGSTPAFERRAAGVANGRR